MWRVLSISLIDSWPRSHHNRSTTPDRVDGSSERPPDPGAATPPRRKVSLHDPEAFGAPASRPSAHRSEEGAQFANEELRLLEGGKVAASRHLAPVPDVGEIRLHPAAHGGDDFLREHSNPGRHRDNGRSPARTKAFPVKARGRRRGRTHPI